MLSEDTVVQMSAHGEKEHEALDKASLVRDMMLSLKRAKR
jgi:hypothetical protein